MDRGWIEDGSSMDRGWIEDGSRLDRGWIEGGSRMDRGWIEDGSRMDLGWIEVKIGSKPPPPKFTFGSAQKRKREEVWLTKNPVDEE